MVLETILSTISLKSHFPKNSAMTYRLVNHYFQNTEKTYAVVPRRFYVFEPLP